MGLDRAQVSQNYDVYAMVTLVLGDGAKTTASAYTTQQQARMDYNPATRVRSITSVKRVGRIRLFIPAGATVNVFDLDGGHVTYVAPAGVPTAIVEIPVVNADLVVGMTGSGTLGIMVLST